MMAAMGLLSCSYGTPNQHPTVLPNDIPPVPPLPEKYAAFSSYRRQNDINMDEEDESSEDDGSPRITQHNDEEYIFGKMDA